MEEKLTLALSAYQSSVIRQIKTCIIAIYLVIGERCQSKWKYLRDKCRKARKEEINSLMIRFVYIMTNFSI